ncbi:hypothetical protein ZYGR_0AS05150 [Zygosaccharomyces rouxii]|uniref:CAP-Gly domain-containing protein n=1 Tax=Zygosaccharomyces rouxii TaxID=4956 RepID=A0A1Q3AHK5_ZYGRO|nr:hypothetical protein ZYGR_0AS05150 [Zygosaccharomyces rouxii]
MVAIGDRVDVNGHQGVVRYIGYTQFAEGVWYGIELNEPVGRNDGSVQGKKYFELGKKGLYGIFAKLQSIKTIDSGSQNSLQGEVSRLLQENDELRRQLQKAETESPNDIIEFLTMETSDLSKNVESLKGQLTVFQQREDTHVKLQAVYVEMERELRYQLEELEKSYRKEIDLLKDENVRLNQELAEKTRPQLEVRDLQSKLKIMEQQVYESRFLKELYEVSLDGTRDKEVAQFEYLSEKILDDRIKNNFVEKQKCRFLLVILSGIAAALTDENTKESFRRSLGAVFQWTTPFLSCQIPEEKVRLTSINHFLDSNSGLRTNSFLVIHCMGITFGKIVPELLAFHMERAVDKPPLTLVTELYSVCLSIQKNCEVLLDGVSNTNCSLTSKTDISVSTIFNTIFQDIFSQFELKFEDDHIFKLTKEILQQVESIFVMEQIDEGQNTDKSEDSQTLEANATRINSKDEKSMHWQSLLHNKEMEVKELTIKNQVYQQRLSKVDSRETESSNMKVEIGDLRECNDHLTQEVIDLKGMLEKTQQKAKREQLRAYQIGPSDGYDDLATELIDSEKLDLISEIRDLRQIVSKYIANENTKPVDLEWLNIPKKTTDTIDIPLRNKIHSLGNEVLDFVNYSTSINLEYNRLKKNYMENAKFKISSIDSAIKDTKMN